MNNILLFLAQLRPVLSWIQADTFVHLSRTCIGIHRHHQRAYGTIAQSFRIQLLQVQMPRPPDIYNWLCQLESRWPLWTSMLGERAHEVLVNARAGYLELSANDRRMRVVLKVWYRWIRRRCMVLSTDNGRMIHWQPRENSTSAWSLCSLFQQRSRSHRK